MDGVPTEQTTQMVYDHLDHLRGVEIFLNFIPATSMEGIRLGRTSEEFVRLREQLRAAG